MDSNVRIQDKKWLILTCVGIGTFLSSLNSSLTNTILPTIERELKISLGQSEWIVLIYLLILTVSLVPIGRLSDLLGHRMIFILGFILFTCAAIVCGFSGSFILLFLGRALLALGGAMILSVGPAIITTTFPPKQRGKVLGLQALMTYIGLSLGPVIGGLLTNLLGWQSTFFVTVPFGILGLLMSVWVVPEVRIEDRKKIDLKGICFFILSMASLTLLLNSNSLTHYRFIVLPLLLIICVFSLWQFFRIEHEAVFPMIDLRLFRIRNFSFGSLGAALNYLCFFLTLFIIPFYFDRVLHSSPLVTGIYLTITPLVMTVCSPIAGALSDRFGSRVFSMFGMVFSTISLILFGLMIRSESFPGFCLLISGLVFSGLGTGTFAAPNNSAILGAAPHSQQGVASGVLATFRYLGMTAGTTIGGSLFGLINTHFARLGFNPESAFLKAFAITMYFGTVFGILGFICSFSMSKRRQEH